MPPKPALNPFDGPAHLKIPLFKPHARPTFHRFIYDLDNINISNRTTLTRKHVLDSWRVSLEKLYGEDVATRQREYSHASDKGSVVLLNEILKRSEDRTHTKLKKDTRLSHSVAEGGIKIPKFLYNRDKTITWSKYVDRLRKANPELDITPEIADRLLEDRMDDMNDTWTGGRSLPSGERKQGMRIAKLLEALRDDVRARDAF